MEILSSIQQSATNEMGILFDKVFNECVSKNIKIKKIGKFLYLLLQLQLKQAE